MSKAPWLAVAGGAATAVLWLFLPLAAPLPLFAAGFGLGLTGALIAAATALVVLALLGGALGLLYAATVLVLPACGTGSRAALGAAPGTTARWPAWWRRCCRSRCWPENSASP